MSNFPDYAGGLTETILLGNLAVWAAASGQGRKWNGTPRISAPPISPAWNRSSSYRPGYTLDV